MSAQHIAQLTLEVWRASGARTEQRRDSLLERYAETYYGPSSQWNHAIRSEVDTARLLTRQRTRIDELLYV